jgi:hypothetical protein
MTDQSFPVSFRKIFCSARLGETKENLCGIQFGFLRLNSKSDPAQIRIFARAKKRILRDDSPL